jgi:hypothetical protein
MLNQDAINERRNPLSKSMEAQKKKEASFVSNKRPDQVYGLAVLDQEKPIIFYVGISKNPAKRFKEHQRAIEHPIIVIKDAYSWLRAHTLRSSLHCIVLDEDGLRTEQDWIDQLVSEGHPLQNMIGGVNCQRKNRKADIKAKETTPKPVPCESFKNLFKSR